SRPPSDARTRSRVLSYTPPMPRRLLPLALAATLAATGGSRKPAAGSWEPSASARTERHAGTGEPSQKPRGGEGGTAGSWQPSASARTEMYAGYGETSPKPRSGE